MNRNAKKLQNKSREHEVWLLDTGKGLYEVVSGTSHKHYLVNVFSDNKAGCNCDWTTKRPAAVNDQKGETVCSHIIAVFNHINKAQWNTVSAWASNEQAQAQHRTIIDIGEGVLLTIRKHRKVYTQLQFAF